MDARQRRQLLKDYFHILRREEEGRGVDIDRKLDIIFEFQRGFRPLPLSRCPHTGAVASFRIDAHDLDGLWWNWGAPLRGEDELPDSYFALSGAMRLAKPLATAPFVCRPGPEVPFVNPRLLSVKGMVAVISSLRVGPHTGFAIVYFANPLPRELPRVNDWGASRYYARTSEGFGSRFALEDLSQCDFDVARWIKRGKLRWIAPEDSTLELRDSLKECPYQGLPGRRAESVIFNGKVA